jgi:hypothetical protein
MLFFCLLREVIRRLPAWAQRVLDQQHRIGPLAPFIYAAPFEPIRKSDAGSPVAASNTARHKPIPPPGSRKDRRGIDT